MSVLPIVLLNILLVVQEPHTDSTGVRGVTGSESTRDVPLPVCVCVHPARRERVDQRWSPQGERGREQYTPRGTQSTILLHVYHSLTRSY